MWSLNCFYYVVERIRVHEDMSTEDQSFQLPPTIYV
jgi:hypothetical protein